MDVFRGFDTEDDAVEYFLDKAYSDSVTVFASKYIPGNNSLKKYFGPDSKQAIYMSIRENEYATLFNLNCIF